MRINLKNAQYLCSKIILMFQNIKTIYKNVKILDFLKFKYQYYIGIYIPIYTIVIYCCLKFKIE